MKKILLLFFLTFFLVECGKKDDLKTSETESADWKMITKLNNLSQAIQDFCFSDAKTIWAVGEKKFCVKSTDGGATWQNIIIDDKISPYFAWDVVYFQTPLIGWVLGGNTVYKTIDGGVTWNSSFDPSTFGTIYSPNDIIFTTLNIGFICSNNGVLISTKDGGKTWEDKSDIKLKGTFHLYSLSFNDVNHGWCVGYNGVLMATTDGGNNWKTLHSPFDIVVNPFQGGFRRNIVSFSNTDLVTSGSSLLRSVDGGNSWGTSEGLIKGAWLYMKNPTEGFCTLIPTGDNPESMAHTVDGGKSWIRFSLSGQNNMAEGPLKIIQNSGSLYGLSGSGGLYKYSK